MKDGRTLAREAIAMGKENSSNQCHMVVGIAPEKQKFWGRDHGKTKHALSLYVTQLSFVKATCKCKTLRHVWVLWSAQR